MVLSSLSTVWQDLSSITGQTIKRFLSFVRSLHQRHAKGLSSLWNGMAMLGKKTSEREQKNNALPNQSSSIQLRKVHGRLNASWKISSLAVNGQVMGKVIKKQPESILLLISSLSSGCHFSNLWRSLWWLVFLVNSFHIFDGSLTAET